MPVHFSGGNTCRLTCANTPRQIEIYMRCKYKIVTSDSARTTFSEVPVLNLSYVVKYADKQYYLGKLFLLYILKNPI